MNLTAQKFASVEKQKKIGTIFARLAVRLSEKGKTMQIVINFNDIDLNDWIDFDDEYSSAPALKDVFKGEILYKFVEKLNVDYEVKQYVRENIDKGLSTKIHAYRDDVAIKAIVEKIVEQRIRDTGSFIFIDQYVSRVEKEVNKYLEMYERRMNEAVSNAVRRATTEIIDRIYAGSAIGEFIDTIKLTDYVLRAIPAKLEGANNG
jgi:hypothetical protein